MGCKNWFSSIIGRHKSKENRSKEEKLGTDQILESANGGGSHSNSDTKILDPNAAASRIQKAFRAHRARKSVGRLGETVRINNILIQGHTVKQQTSSTLSHLHLWCNIQAQIRSRRLYMVTNGRLKQKRLENQLKLEAKLHGLEVEWCGGSETMEEILSRIQQREDAAVKRERALAYAFNHQWRANASQYLGQASYSLEKENWGWSWMERWIAARPWEFRAPGAGYTNQGNKSEKEVKASVSNGKITSKVKKIDPAEVQ